MRVSFQNQQRLGLGAYFVAHLVQPAAQFRLLVAGCGVQQGVADRWQSVLFDSSGGDGHHPQEIAKQINVNDKPGPLHFIEEVQGDHQRLAHVEQVPGQEEVALKVGGVHYV